MNITLATIKDASDYVAASFKAYLESFFLYHNLSHTRCVVKATSTLCDAMRIDENQRAILLTAAWFHDLGFTDQIEGHEKAGADLAECFLKAKGINEDQIAMVKACILATSYPQKTTNSLEAILCDADLLYLGNKDFLQTSEALRKEWELTKGVFYTDEEWCHQNIRFLSAHQFHTTQARTIAEDGKQRNIRHLKRSLQNRQNGRMAKLTSGNLLKDNSNKAVRRLLNRYMETSAPNTKEVYPA